MNEKEKPLTVRQECAAHIVANPGCRLTDIVEAVVRYQSLASRKQVCRALLEMFANHEIVRHGTRKKFTYTPGVNIEFGLAGKLIIRSKQPRRIAQRMMDDDADIINVNRAWLAPGSYSIDVKCVYARSVFDWASR